MSDYSDNDSQVDTDSEKEPSDYISLLIERILCQYDENDDVDVDPKDIYTAFRKKVKFYFKEFKLMKADPLWEKIAEEATDFKDENHEVYVVSDEAAFDHALRKYKPIILDLINHEMYESDDDDDEADDDNEPDNVNDDDMNEDNVNGIEAVEVQGGTGRRFRRHH